MSATQADPQTRRRWWRLELDHYPGNAVRYRSLILVVLVTVVMYYQLYLMGGLAVSIMGEIQISFMFLVYISVVGSLLAAVASFATVIADLYGRVTVVVVGLVVVALLCIFAVPMVHDSWSYAVVVTSIGLVEGFVLVATPALVRDFSPQVGRGAAMGFWTLGPVLGSLVVALQVSNGGDMAWRTHYIIAGVVGLVLAVVTAIWLRELSPRLRSQLMVSTRERVLVEARAKGIDVVESMKRPFRQMLKPDIVLSAFAIAAFLIIYYAAVGVFPIYFQTVFGFSQAQANALGNWMWACEAVALVLVGYLSDRLLVRKPFMVLGAICAIVSTLLLIIHTTQPDTSYATFKWILVGIGVSLGITYAPWMASFSETVEQRNPALVATGMAVKGMVLRLVVATTAFIMPLMVNTVTTIVQEGKVVASLSATGGYPTGMGPELSDQQKATVKAVAADPAIMARLPTLGQSPDNAALYARYAPLRDRVVQDALTELHTGKAKVQQALKESPRQWQRYFWLAVIGQLVFIPLIFMLTGFWSPRRARKAAAEHEAWLAAELAKYREAGERGPDRVA